MLPQSLVASSYEVSRMSKRHAPPFAAAPSSCFTIVLLASWLPKYETVWRCGAQKAASRSQLPSVESGATTSTGPHASPSSSFRWQMFAIETTVLPRPISSARMTLLRLESEKRIQLRASSWNEYSLPPLARLAGCSVSATNAPFFAALLRLPAGRAAVLCSKATRCASESCSETRSHEQCE